LVVNLVTHLALLVLELHLLEHLSVPQLLLLIKIHLCGI